MGDWNNFDPKIRVENLVYTCKLGTELNLQYVSQQLKCKGAEYNPKKFAAVIIRSKNSARQMSNLKKKTRWDEESRSNSAMSHFLYHTETKKILKRDFHRRPKIAVLAFSPGKIVCTGAKTPPQARHMINKMVTYLKEIGYKNTKIVSLNIENMVGSVHLPSEISPAKLAAEYPLYCTYDPEQFPGAIFRYPPIQPMTILVFHSGKLVITGARSIEKAKEAFLKVLPILAKFKENFRVDKSIISKNINHTDDPYIKPTRDINQNVNKYVDEILHKISHTSNNSESEKTKRDDDSITKKTDLNFHPKKKLFNGIESSTINNKIIIFPPYRDFMEDLINLSCLNNNSNNKIKNKVIEIIKTNFIKNFIVKLGKETLVNEAYVIFEDIWKKDSLIRNGINSSVFYEMQFNSIKNLLEREILKKFESYC